jgi:serine/threonine protein kinase
VLDDQGAKLADLGVSQLLNPGQTITGAAQMGAIEYLSPEVIQGRPASRATDIWALGATLHRVLTGVSIYPNLPTHSLVEALRFLLNEKPVMGDALRNGERRIIEEVVSADPADRPHTADDLAVAISEEAERQAGKIKA